MILETKRLTLRPWEDSDAADCFRFASNERVARSCGFLPHQSPEESAAIIRSILSAPETYALVLNSTGQVIGNISLNRGRYTQKTTQPDEAELGCWLGEPFWGQGLMVEAATALLNYGFDTLNLIGCWAGYFEGNHQSARLQEKLGFQPHHIHEQLYVKPLDCTLVEHVTYLSKDRWKELQPDISL